MAENDDDNKPFDKFELATALLLGVTAIGAALSGWQGGQWGGKQLEAFAASNALTTKAATQYNQDTVSINADYAAVAAAKTHILVARDSRDDAARERELDLASYQYMNQMTLIGYQAMGLPGDYYVEDEEESTAAGDVAEPAAAGAATTEAGEAAAEEPVAEEEEEVEEEEVAPEAALEREIPDEDLLASLAIELDEEYIDKMLKEGNDMFDEADKKFEEGRVANSNGDKFALAGLYFTVALFFAGLGLVFKTRVRWGFFCAGGAIFVLTSIYMMTFPWA